MADSSVIQPTKTVVQRSSISLWRSLLVLVFRLLLLGVGGVSATLVGIAVASLYPDQVTEPPLAEQMLRQIEGIRDSLGRSPEVQGGELANPSFPDVDSPEAAPQATNLDTLTAAERQQIMADLRQLDAEFQELSDRVTRIEQELGVPVNDASLEVRLEIIEQSLNPGAAPTIPAVPTDPLTSPDATIPTTAVGESVLMVTLPSEALFEPDRQTLRPSAQEILDSVISDLDNYPDATIRVAAYPGNLSNRTRDRDRAFIQAKAVQTYLANNLGNNYHWLVLGYGSQLINPETDTMSDRQPIQRIEITIDPR